MEIVPVRYMDTTIPGTVWDDYAGDYRSLADIDWEAPDVKEFIELYYPTLVPELAAYQDSMQRDVPIDPLLREYGYSSW